MKKIYKQTFDEEREFYNCKDVWVDSCVFSGPKDGESCFKECENIKITNTKIDLRYSLWHDNKIRISNSEISPLCRAALWYTKNLDIRNSKLFGIKALRECKDISIKDCQIDSQEFGWRSKNITLQNIKVTSGDYFMFESKNLKLKNVNLNGKYTFQYVHDMTIENCNFVTKDAFWHSKNVTVKNSTIDGQYLAWYSNGLTLINCTIKGTQPLCYCKNLKLINCKMIDCDLAFEYSDVDASIKGFVDSIKNPKSGQIVVDEIKELILKDSKYKNKCLIKTKK